MSVSSTEEPEQAIPTGSPSATAVAGTRTPLPTWKKALFGLVTVVLVLGFLELALVLAGVEPASKSEDPFVGFSSSIPHFDVEQGIVHRAASRATVMNDFAFPEAKPKATTRIFCVGGSTTYGRPFWDETSFAGYLREMLPAAVEDAQAFEVVNAGGMSYASYRVTGVMREAARFDPDVFVVFAGHNEFLERRTYEAIREMSPLVRDAAAILSGTRMGSLIRMLAGAVPHGPQGLDEDVQRISIDAVGPEAYHRDDAWRDEVIAEFRDALNGMVDLADAAGAKIVLVVPTANVRDCPPFKSQASDALAPADVATFLARLDAGRRALDTESPESAINPLREATALDPRYAEAWYLLGRALLAAGEMQAADSAFQRALEEDVCALRASSGIQQAVRDVAAERGVPAVEFGSLIDEPGGIGVASISDHVHPWPAANALLAEAIVAALAETGAVTPSAAWGPDAARSAADRVNARIDTQKHGSEMVRLTFVLASLDKRDLARAVAERASRMLGDNALSLLAAAGGLEAGGDKPGALALADRALAREPNSAEVLGRVGVLLAGAGDKTRAREILGRALDIDADRVEAHAHLGVLDAESGDLRSAESHFREVLRLRPEMADSHYNLALVLLRQGRSSAAELLLVEALRIDPAHANATRRLAALRK